MPQMAPMSWTLIFYMSISLLLVCSIKTYFLSQAPTTSLNKSPMKVMGVKTFWKW